MNTKLELTWLGKENRPRLEPRILVEEPGLSYHAKERVTEGDVFDNVLIQGDNLLALKALEAEYEGKVKCIYIDPPYNTGQAFDHYDDGMEHSIWLTMMRDRLECLRTLLHPQGVIAVQLDDNEFAYCKVLMDEVFGRSNFINQISIKTKNTAGASGGGEDRRLKKNVEFLLLYAKETGTNEGFQRFNDVFVEEDLFELIEEMEGEGKSWKYTSVLVDEGELVETRTILDGSGLPIRVEKRKGILRTTLRQIAKQRELDSSEPLYFEFYEKIFSDTNAQTSIRQRIIDEFLSLEEDECLVASYVPRSGRDKGQTVRHHYISPTIRRVIWLKDSSQRRGNRIVKLEKLGTHWQGFNWNNVTKEGGVALPFGKKPEALIQRVFEICTDQGDLILDSFAGSGTAGAVAQKMGRRWIMVELGPQALTHIVPRLTKVIDGDDHAGITKASGIDGQGWKGGGGFRFYRLAPSLLKEDRWGHYVINPAYNAEMLARAVCLHEGFAYAPSETEFWVHGRANESSYLYVTTQHLTREQLQALSDEVGPDRSLRILCAAFSGGAEGFDNLEVKKIPSEILGRCEWDHDDYSLEVANLPARKEEAAPEDMGARPARKRDGATPDLFAEEGA